MAHYSLDIYTDVVSYNASYISEDLGYIIDLYNSNLRKFKNEKQLTMNVRLCFGMTSYSVATYFNETYLQDKKTTVFDDIFKKELEEI